MENKENSNSLDAGSSRSGCNSLWLLWRTQLASTFRITTQYCQIPVPLLHLQALLDARTHPCLARKDRPRIDKFMAATTTTESLTEPM